MTSIRLATDRMRSLGRTVFVLLVLSLFSIGSIAAPPAKIPNATEIISKSQLTFSGKVTDVQYRLSQEGVPHTFVTYSISKIIHGGVEGKDRNKITLRFMGGPSGDGSYLWVSTAPTFNIGDEDVLFVAENGESECPLVGCRKGRLRILHDRVYTNSGQPVIGIEKGRFVSAGEPDPSFQVTRYPRPDFDQLYKRKEFRELLNQKAPKADPKLLREVYEKHVPKEVSVERVHFPGSGEDSSDTGLPRKKLATRDVTDVRGKHVGISDLHRALGNSARVVKKPLAPAKNLNKAKPFSIKVPGPVQTKALAPPVPRTVQMPTKVEQNEIRMLKQQGFNPVLK